MELTEQKKELIAQFEEWLNEIEKDCKDEWIDIETKIPYLSLYEVDVFYYTYSICYDSEYGWIWWDLHYTDIRYLKKGIIKKWFRKLVNVTDCNVKFIRR